eukprot:3411955-Rhodomonas_salina.2
MVAATAEPTSATDIPYATVARVLPEEEYVPATHKVHAYDPDAGLYVPSSHAVHGPPSGPEYPALHRHSATDVRPGSAIRHVRTGNGTADMGRKVSEPATLLEFVGQTVSTVAAWERQTTKGQSRMLHGRCASRSTRRYLHIDVEAWRTCGARLRAVVRLILACCTRHTVHGLQRVASVADAVAQLCALAQRAGRKWT